MITLTAMTLAAALAGSAGALYLALESARARRLESQFLGPPPTAEVAPDTPTSRPATATSSNLPGQRTASAAPVEPEGKSLQEDPLAIVRHQDLVASANRVATTLVADMTSSAGLDKHESDQLRNLMAESYVRDWKASTECRTTPGCDIDRMKADHQLGYRSELERILPLAKLQRLDYMEESARVDRFREDPGGSTLPAGIASELALALSEERFRIAGNNETREEFNRRLYSQAQRLLTPEQLARFQNLQERHFARDY